MASLRPQNAVHNIGCPVVSRVTSFETFLSNVDIFYAILNGIICHASYAQRLSHTSCFSQLSEQV